MLISILSHLEVILRRNRVNITQSETTRITLYAIFEVLSELLQHGGEGGQQPKSIFSFGQPIHHLETSTDSKLINYTAMPSPFLPSRAFVYFLCERSSKELHAKSVAWYVGRLGNTGLAALKHQLYSV